MAQQPPPRKGAYNKTVSNLHKEQLANIQAKNQQELDLLDDIKAFMKQKSTIEKNYAEGLLKLSAVYGTKKIACKIGLELNQGEESGDQTDASGGDQNIFKIWKRILEENEKIANLRLAAAQVFQENISDDAKNLRATKSVQAKKYLDRFTAIQRDVQVSVGELDRTRFTYFSEESDAIRVANRAEEAELKAKGKKKDVMSIFQSKTALEKQAGKLCAKQEELNIKSTGARNDYLLALETANAHQERYFHFDMKKTLAGMEGNAYEKISEYLVTLATTELATCNAAHGSFGKIKEQSQSITREYNYQCYLKAFTSLSNHIQYDFEPVQGDGINMVTMPEDDAGLSYALNREAREAADKYNNAIKMISAFRKRINSLYKAKKQMQVPDPSIDEKIEELDNSIDNAESEKAKADAKLKKLREGGVSVDKYLDAISVCSDANKEHDEMNDDWDMHEDTATAVEEVNYFSYDQISYGGDTGAKEQVINKGEAEAAWGATGDWNEPKVTDSNPTALDSDWANPATTVDESTLPVTDVDGKQEFVKAVVLFLFSGDNDDELAVAENEEVLLIVKECDEDGWVMAKNTAGKKGLVPSSFVQVLDTEAANSFAQPPGHGTTEQNNSFEKSLETQQPSLVIPSCPPPDVEDDTSSEEDSEDEDNDMPPPGLAPPPGPPPQLGPTPSCSFQAKSLYEFLSTRSDELSLEVNDVILVTSRAPNGDEDGWWLGQLNGKTGLFPTNYVEECKQPESSEIPGSPNEEPGISENKSEPAPVMKLEEGCTDLSISKTSTMEVDKIKNDEISESKKESVSKENNTIGLDEDSDIENDCNKTETDTVDKPSKILSEVNSDSDSDSGKEDAKIVSSKEVVKENIINRESSDPDSDSDSSENDDKIVDTSKGGLKKLNAKAKDLNSSSDDDSSS